MTKHFTTKTNGNGITSRTFGERGANCYYVELHTYEDFDNKPSELVVYHELDDGVYEVVSSTLHPCETKAEARESVREMLSETYAQALKCYDAKRVLATLTEFAQFVL